MATWVDVSAEDIVKRWRPLTANESTVATQLIEDATDELEEALEDLGLSATDFPADSRNARKYVRTIATMVKRVLVNLEGYLTETIDDYTYRFDSAVSSGALYLADDELNNFRPKARRRGSAFTIRPR